MKKVVLFFLLIIAAQFSNAQIGAQNAFEFLRMPISARAIGLGGYVPAYNFQDLGIAVASPSLLNKNYDRNFVVNQEIMFGNIFHGQAAYARYNKQTDATFAANIQYLNYGDFIRTDETGAQTGHFGAEEMALQLGFGKVLNPRFTYGANAKFIFSRYDDLIATAVAADLGATYKDTTKRITITFQIVNFGAQLKTFYPSVYYETSHVESIPTDIRIGINKRLAHMPLGFFITAHHLNQFDIRYDNPADNITTNILAQDSVVASNHIADKIFRHLTFGGEFYFGKHVTIQIGYNHLRRMELSTAVASGLVGFSGGFHIQTKRFTFGFAHAWYYLPSATNTLTLSFQI